MRRPWDLRKQEAENSVNGAVSVGLIIHPSVLRGIRMFSQKSQVSLNYWEPQRQSNDVNARVQRMTKEAEKFILSLKVRSNRSVVSDFLRRHGLQPTRLLHPWIFQARVLEWVAIFFSRDLPDSGMGLPHCGINTLRSEPPGNQPDGRTNSLSPAKCLPYNTWVYS